MRSSHLATVGLTLATGCFGPQSKLDSHSSVTLSGIVQTQNGAPTPTTTAKLIRHPDPLQALGEILVAVGSVGLACLGGQLDICSSFAESKTAGDGSYQFAMRGADTQGSTGEALTFTVFAGCAAQPAPAVGDCAVSADFIVQTPNLKIPALRQWTGLGSEDDSSGDPHFNWPSLESTVGGAAASDYRVSVRDTLGNLVWLQDAKTNADVVVDRHATQDFAGSWSAIAHRKQRNDNTDFDVTWYSSQQDYASRFLNPLSRTSDCYVQTATGMALVPRPCPLTDGSMTTRFVPVAAPTCPAGQTCSNPPQNNWIAFDITFQHPMALLVLYDVAISGATQKIAIESSNDLMTWAPVTTVAATQYQVIPLSVVAQFLRLRVVDADGAFTGSGNSEIAIYAPGA
jgi:hypothetical protein